MTPAQQAVIDLHALGSDGIVARALGVDASTVHNWRTGQAKPRPYALGKLLQLHGDVFGPDSRVVAMDGEACAATRVRGVA